jgi:hypothetical protein
MNGRGIEVRFFEGAGISSPKCPDWTRIYPGAYPMRIGRPCRWYRVAVCVRLTIYRVYSQLGIRGFVLHSIYVCLHDMLWAVWVAMMDS